MAVAALVLGILSIVCGVVSGSGLGLVGVIMAIVGIILGAQARKDPQKNGMATAGLVCSIIGLLLNIVVFIACMACFGGILALGAAASAA